METSRKVSPERSPSRTFIRLFTLPYKRQDKAGDSVSEIQSVLCEDVVCLKRVIVVLRSTLQGSVEQFCTNCFVYAIVLFT